MKLELHATPEEVMRAVETLEEFARSCKASDKTIFSLALSLEECASNIVNHALRRDARQRFWIEIEHVHDAIFIELRDGGPEFDPTVAMAQAPRKDDDVPGGWGLQLVHRYMDEVRYQREAGENVLRLRKRLTPSAKKT